MKKCKTADAAVQITETAKRKNEGKDNCFGLTYTTSANDGFTAGVLMSFRRGI